MHNYPSIVLKLNNFKYTYLLEIRNRSSATRFRVSANAVTAKKKAKTTKY